MKRLFTRRPRTLPPRAMRLGLIVEDNSIERRYYLIEDGRLTRQEQLPAETDWIIAFEKADQRYAASQRRAPREALAYVLSQPNVDEEARLLNLSGAPHRAIYARAIDAILDEPAPITPGPALLDLLYTDPVPAEGRIAGLLFGALGQGCVAVLVAHAPNGQVVTQVVPDADETRIAQYIGPFAQGHHLTLSEDLPLFSLDQILALATAAPRYDREDRVLGLPRSRVERLAAQLLGAACLVTLGGAGWEGVQLWTAQREAAAAAAATQTLLTLNARRLAAHPLQATQTMSLPVAELFRQAEALWKPTTRVRFEAQGHSVLYTVAVSTRTDAGRGSAQPWLSRANSPQAVEAALLARPPAGLTRSDVRATGDMNVIEIDYGQALPARLAGLVVR